MKLDYQLGAPPGEGATFGLVALQTDEAVEVELRRLIPFRAGLYVTRIPVAAEITPDSLAAMETALPASVGLLPSARRFDAIGYACTSGATVIGPERVSALVRGAAQASAVVDPLSATIDACRALDVRRIGFVTPYLPEVSATMRAALEAAGLTIAAFGSFEQSDDATVARIAPTSIRAAALKVGADPAAEAVFVACTNLQALSVIADVEAALGKPMLASNLVLGWRMLRAAETAPADPSLARLLAL